MCLAPVSMSADQPDRASAMEVSQDAVLSLTVLVLDDEPNIRRVLGISLEAEGHQVIAVSNKKDALSEARRRCIDLALVDLRLGTESGMELISALRGPVPGPGLSSSPPMPPLTRRWKQCGGALSTTFQSRSLMSRWRWSPAGWPNSAPALSIRGASVLIGRSVCC